MSRYLLLLLALAGGSVSAKCVMTEGDLKGLVNKPVSEAQALVESPVHGCSFTVNQVIPSEGQLSRQPPIRQGQKWETDTVIVNVLRLHAEPAGSLMFDSVSEAVLHQCPTGVSRCPVNVPFREGRQFFGGHYRVDPEDRTLYDTLTRVANQDGRKFIWDAGPSLVKDVPIQDIPYFRLDALGVAVTSLGAFEKVLSWQSQWMDDYPYEKPLFLCVHPNAYRMVREPNDCSSTKPKADML